MKSISKKVKTLLTATFLLLSSTIVTIAQIPQNIDPGQEANPPSIWQSPQYIVPIAVIIVLLVGFGYWRKKQGK